MLGERAGLLEIERSEEGRICLLQLSSALLASYHPYISSNTPMRSYHFRQRNIDGRYINNSNIIKEQHSKVKQHSELGTLISLT